MKRRTALCLLCLLCLLTACKEKTPETTSWTTGAMVQAILLSQETAEETQTIVWGDGLFDTYISDYYGLQAEEIADGAIAYAGGVSALEIAVLRLTDEADPDKAVQALTDYIDRRAGAFAGYAPEQYAILEGADVASRGQYAALLICPDVKAAEEAFTHCFTSAPGILPDPAAKPLQPVSEPEPAPDEQPEPDQEPAEPAETVDLEPAALEPDPPDPPDQPDESDAPPSQESPAEPVVQPEPQPEPEEPWSYDEQRILNAWSGNNSRDGLWEQDKAILKVLEGISALTDGTLTDYERELALHDWMIAWAEYDPGALSNNPRGEPMPDNDNPYGFLTGQKGICLGYASTFQLLMDLSGIECVTVSGWSHQGTAEHAWNLVRLDGEWYAVDTTWDDPVASFQVPESTAHLYFNVTDDFLRQNDHQWDEAAAPAATGTVWVWS